MSLSKANFLRYARTFVYYKIMTVFIQSVRVMSMLLELCLSKVILMNDVKKGYLRLYIFLRLFWNHL